MARLLILVVIILCLLGGVFYLKNMNSSQAPKPVDLTIWGLWNDPSAFQPAIDGFQKLHPNVKISYVHQNLVNYRNRVENEVLNSQGPDIFIMHNSWTQMFLSHGALSKLPPEVMSLDEFSKDFYPAAKQSLTQGNDIYSLPLEQDGLEMYYNQDLLQQASNSAVPKNWFEFRDTAKKLTQMDAQGNIQVSGAALGDTQNIAYWPEIVGLLIAQEPGSDLSKPGSRANATALSFYSQFVSDKTYKTWDANLPSDTSQFINGKLAFYFAPYSQAAVIKSANPNLHFGIAPVPQIPLNPTITWSGFWTWAVSPTSPNQLEAWQFLKYLTSLDTEKKLYQANQNNPANQMVFSQVGMKDVQGSDSLAAAFIQDAPFGISWYLNPGTEDNGINDDIVSIYSQAVDGAMNGDAGNALSSISDQVKSTLVKDLAPPSPSPTP